MMRTLILTMLLIIELTALYGQTGKLTGRVIDAKTGEDIVGAAVVIDGTTTGSITDLMGEFTVQNIAPGQYTFRCQMISYEPEILNEVTISAGKTTTVEIKLKTVELDLQEVEIVAKVNRSSEKMLLLEQKNAVIASQAIGSQELSRKGISDAQAAVTKVSGISKQEGVKNVFVRGLGDRFNSTSLNGFPIPSEDPEYKNISLDFFGSGMIQSVGVNKVFGARTAGDVGGADINIVSKELMGSKELAVDLSVAANSQSYSHDMLRPDGVNDWGFANHKKDPINIKQYSFENSLDPTAHNATLNNGFAIAGGKKIMAGASQNPLNIYLMGSYNNDFEYSHGVVRNTTTTGTIFQDMDFEKSRQNTSHMVLASLDYRFKNNTLTYNALVIHNNSQYVGDYDGLNSVFEDAIDFQGFLRRQQINDNTLYINQLNFTSKFKERWSYHLGASDNIITGNEPDRRMNYLSDYGNGLHHPTKGTGRQQRYFSKLNESDLNLKASVTYQLTHDDNNKSALTLAYNGRLVDRTFEAIEYDQQVVHVPDFYLNPLKLDHFFNQSGLDNGDFKLDRNSDEYSVTKCVHSGYGELVYQFNKLTAVVGVRADKVNMDVDYNVNRGGTRGTVTIDDIYALPSLNLKYDASDKSSFRMGVSQTYTLPQAKEISPFRYVDVSFKSQGNPKLRASVNYNIDLKWDYYLSDDELLSITGFSKYIKDPISRVEKASAGGFLTYDNIADHSLVEGIELEVRKNIFNTIRDEAGHKLTAGVNTSYIFTNVKLDDANFTNNHSQLEGAAPFIINADLSFNTVREAFSLTNSLVFNYFSDRIYTIGTQGYQDINEEGIATLDFVSSCKFNQHWSMSFKAKNLLDPAYRITRDPNAAGAAPVVLSEYHKGTTFSIGLSYKL